MNNQEVWIRVFELMFKKYSDIVHLTADQIYDYAKEKADDAISQFDDKGDD